MIFLTSSVKLFTKCESFPRFTTNVFGTFVEDDLTFFFSPFVFSSLTACVRFFFLRVFAISVNNNTHSFSRFLSTEQRRDTKKTKTKETNSKRLLKWRWRRFFLTRVSFLRAKRLSQKRKKNRRESQQKNNISSHLLLTSHETKKRNTIVFPGSPLRARY